MDTEGMLGLIRSQPPLVNLLFNFRNNCSDDNDDLKKGRGKKKRELTSFLSAVVT